MLDNCFRFAPRDSIPGLIAKICKYLKDHPGWSEAELENQIKQFIGQNGVESFNGRNGAVVLNEDDVNNLKIASAYFAEGNETIDKLDLVSLYNQGVRFVFTDFNSVTHVYNTVFALEYLSGSGGVVYYPISTGSGGGGNIVSVNGKTGEVHLKVVDVSSGNSPDENAYIFIDESDDYPDVISSDSSKLGGQLPSYYSSAEEVSSLKDDIAHITKVEEKGGSINLFNKLTVTNDKNISDNGTLRDENGFSASDFIPVEANTEYTQMTINDGIMYPITQYIGFYDFNKNAIGATTSEPWYNCTTPSNCAYVRIAFPTELIDMVMFVKGLYSPDGTPSSKMDYIPYSEKYLVFTVRGDKVDFKGTQVEKNEKDIDGLKKGAILPSYWETYLDEKIAEINAELVKGFCFPVLFVTDTHIEDDTSLEPEIIKYLNKKIHFGAVVHGGDYITNDTNRLNAFTKIQNAISLFDGIPNLLTCIGNHDGANAIIGDVLPKNIADNVVNSHLSKVSGISKPKYDNSTVPQYTDLMANGYYYKDDETNRIRYIILNSCDSIRVDGTDHGFAFNNLQLKWLAQNALDLTEKGYGWKVAIFSHLFSNQNGIIGSETEPNTYQIDVLKDILEAFISKTTYSNTTLDISTDYTNQPDPKFCGYFCGHYHYDSQTKVGNIPVSVTLNASLNQYAPSGYTATEKTVGTTTETAMDVLIFGKDKCILKRIGAGNDREFTY